MGILDKLKKSKEANEVAKKTSEPLDKNVKTAPSAKAKQEDGRAHRAHAVLKKSHISEKAAHGETKGQYTFIVARQADKVSIKDAVEALYGVRPATVRTQLVQGKDTAFGYRRGRRSDWKKAVVTLPKGKTIHIHEGV